VSRGTLQVRFESIYTDRLYHLYAGREKVGQTSAVGERVITARLKPSRWPARLTLLAVLPSVSNRDFGDQLPPRAYNAPRIRFTASGESWATAKTLEVLTSAAPGDPIGEGVERARAVFEWQGEYVLPLRPLPGSGYWPVRVQGRDNAPPTGNVGAAAETVVRVAAHPPDLVPVSSSRRFAISVAGGVATIECEIGS